MTALERIEAQEASRLATSFALSLLFFVMAMTLAKTFLTAKPKLTAVEAPLLEAEFVEHHEPPKLHEAKSESVKRSMVPAISKKLADKNEKPKEDPLKNAFEEKNQTESSAAPASATHGPVAVSSPAPKLPDYFKNQNIKASVLIEFLISAKGESTPRLIGSSGNEELDALAISTAKKWVFEPAVDKGVPLVSKMRLRINFEVE